MWIIICTKKQVIYTNYSLKICSSLMSNVGCKRKQTDGKNRRSQDEMSKILKIEKKVG